VLGAAFQTARNAFQRSLVDTAGPWGATLVRFLFGLPFAMVWVGAAWLIWGGAQDGEFHPLRFLLAAAGGAFAQIIATAALLQSMRKSNFAVGAFFQQLSLPLSALGGLAFGDVLSSLAFAGVAVTTVGLFVLSWPKQTDGVRNWDATRYGIVAGAAFGLSGNAFREATHAVSLANPAFAAAAALVVVQALQSAGLGAWLARTDRPALNAALGAWRVSLGAGFCGWAASACTFTGLAMAPAAMVRVVAVVDMPFAAIVGGGLFRERLSLRQITGATIIAGGVIACALGYR
jgi:drug/metabolite transporter (DMT)-like permease